ncbi:NUDIX hydrolase [Pseudohongiella spirulinae]|uniref:Phosphatase NudJ n=1 Tax=Pseudohongiella spirulinae TaxID=1249552 RepID=A0A0S2KD31_9GAMM|nr:NUDIX hydrolase [Pseudohongiella spirulinae]ALO46221.1 MutT/nudix family protein [Pseudohongiella spirulinae]
MTFCPHNTVAVVVEQPAELKTPGDITQRFLIVEEISDGRQVFNQPAGHLEKGETLLQAALRETLEETAWQISLTGCLGQYQYTSPDNGECYLRTCFVGRALSHDPALKLDADIVQTHWLSQQELQQRQAELRSPLVMQVINDYLQGRVYPLNSVQHID